MNNVDLLPVNQQVKNRLVKFARMHRMYGGPEIDIGTVIENSVLVLIKYEGEEFTNPELLERAEDVFDGEMAGFQFYFAINSPYNKHIPTSDGRHIFRIDHGPFKATIRRDSKRGNVVAKGVSYRVQITQGSHDEYLQSQLEKWVQTSIVRDNLEYDESPDINLDDVRPLDDVLEELFSSARLPEAVRVYQSKYRRSELAIGRAIQVAEEYTPYRCIVVCLPKSDENGY